MLDPERPAKAEDAPLKHPYQNFVKPILADKLKYSHNSIYANPVYPVRAAKERNLGQIERVKFSIYGIRSIPEFNYSVQIAQGLHRYRPYLFDAPDIQAITCVDWPKTWMDLKVRFGGITYCVESSVVILINGNLLGGLKEFEQYVKARYNYYLCLDYYKLAVDSFVRFIRSSGRPHAYMHIAIDDEVIGTFIFRLYSDILPSTCDNFLRLCNATRGGYGGTPIHRIVKDNWIQGGGYGLKNNPNLDCENFIVPHDKRGVLGMANDGRNCDCSTQFFILLQPSPWMASKYVAFGQLIDGEQTLAKIENVPTFYESPLSNIVIVKAGILNLEATDIVISRGTTEFIHGHIEDLISLGTAALGWLMQRLDLEIEMIEVARLALQGEGQEAVENEGVTAAVGKAERFMRKKGAKGQGVEGEWHEEQVPNEGRNDDFDVEEYEYVYEEEVIYKQLTPPASIDVRPARPYYIPLTDVPYPGEKDSTYDLKKFLTGDYCLESDLAPSASPRKAIRFDPSLHHDEDRTSQDIQDESSEVSVYSLDTEDESEIRKYLRNYSDQVSFAGGVVTKIAKGMKDYRNIYEERHAAERASKARKVSLAVPDDELPAHKIKRRQTGFVPLSPADMEGVTTSEMMKLALGMGESSDGAGRHVRIAGDHGSPMGSLMTPKQRMSGVGARAGFVHVADDHSTEDSERNLNVMKRLYEEVTLSDEALVPTLKDYRPLEELHKKSLMLTHSLQLHREDSVKSKFRRESYTQDAVSIDQLLTLQHGKRFARKISSDYVKTIDQFEQPLAMSLRSLEYSKVRPAMSVAEYQARNDLYRENLKREKEEAAWALAHPKSSSLKLETRMEPPEIFTATTQSFGEEERPYGYEVGEEKYDDVLDLTSVIKREEMAETYEKTENTTKTEETKTVKTYMDPPQLFNTRSTTSAIDEASMGGDGAARVIVAGNLDDSPSVSAASLKV